LASIEKAQKLLGYSPQYSFKKGLTEAIDWYWNDLKG
jgi:UDP-N-acetylglucosamine 4-epimerase